MKKTLYSLMLNEEVVREVDALAHQMGTNRSALINQILADYVSVLTPERRIENIFHAIEEMVAPVRELVPFFVPNATTMTLKSSLQYKYRPTVKYEVALSRGDGDELGELSVAFRTQSAELLENMTYFFRLWKRIEDIHLSPLRSLPIRYALYDGKFTRTLALPQDRDYTSDEIAKGISEYIKIFDHLMKGYLAGRYTPNEVEAIYMTQVRGNQIIV